MRLLSVAVVLLEITVIVVRVAPALLVPLVVVAFVDPPGIVHHQLEVGIVIDGCTDVTVVVPELYEGDDSVVHFLNVTVLFESVHEFLQDLLPGLFSIDEFGVSVHIVHVDQIVDFHYSIPILIEFIECLIHYPLSEVVHGTPQDD